MALGPTHILPAGFARPSASTPQWVHLCWRGFFFKGSSATGALTGRFLRRKALCLLTPVGSSFKLIQLRESFWFQVLRS